MMERGYHVFVVLFVVIRCVSFARMSLHSCVAFTCCFQLRWARHYQSEPIYVSLYLLLSNNRNIHTMRRVGDLARRTVVMLGAQNPQAAVTSSASARWVSQAHAAGDAPVPVRKVRKPRSPKKTASVSGVDIDAEHKRSVAQAMRDDFWDDDVLAVTATSETAGRHHGTDRPASQKRSRRKKHAGAPESAWPARPVAQAPLKFAMEDLIEALDASRDGTVESSSSKLLHDVASVKRVDGDAVDAAITFARNAFQHASSSPAHRSSLSSIHKLCQYYAARGAILGHARMVSIMVSALSKDATPIATALQQVLHPSLNSSSDNLGISVWVDTLYELFERPQFWYRQKIGRAKHVVSVLEVVKAGSASLFNTINDAVSAGSSVLPNAPLAADAPVRNGGVVRQLTSCITVADILLKVPDNTDTSSTKASMKHLEALRASAHLSLVDTVRVMMSPAATLDSDALVVCFELASNELVTWGPAARANIRTTIAESFANYCAHLTEALPISQVETFLSDVAMSPLVMQQLCRIAIASTPCYDRIARSVLSCAAAVLGAQNFSSADERLAFVQHYAQRFIDAGLPSDTLLSSQWSIGLSGKELLVVLRIHNRVVRTQQLNEVTLRVHRPLVPIPEILVRTLTAQLDSSVAAVKVMCSELLPSVMSDASPSSVKLDKIASRDAAVELALQDAVQLLTEFVLRGMVHESQLVATQLIAVWQAAEKTRRDPPVLSFLRGCATLREYYTLVASRCEVDDAILWPEHAQNAAQARSHQSSGADPMGCLRNSWTVLVSKVIDPSLGQLVSGGHIATLTKQDDDISLGAGDDSTRRSGLSAVLSSYSHMLSVSCAVNSHHASQLAKHIAPLFGAVVSSVDVCRYIGDLSATFGDVCSQLLTPTRLVERQQASRLFQIAVQGVLASHPSLCDTLDPWSDDWSSVAALLSVVEHMSRGAIDAPETAELLTFRTSCLMEVVTRHMKAQQGVFVPAPPHPLQTFTVLNIIADVMYQRRTVHLVSDAFDKDFTACFVNAVKHVATLESFNAEERQQLLHLQFAILATSTVMLLRGTEATIERWIVRCDATLAQCALVPQADSHIDQAFKHVATEDLIGVLRALASHMNDGVRQRVFGTVHRQLLPLLQQHAARDFVGGGVNDAPWTKSSLTFTVEMLRTLPSIGVDDAPLLEALLSRILANVDQLSLGDCGELAGFVPMLVQAGQDAAQLLPAALAERAFEKRLLANASEVAKLVRGFSALNSTPSLKKLRDKVLTGLILRSMHVVPFMKPAELLDTLEAYLSMESSHMSLIGILVAKIADAKDSFSLPLTIRLVTASYDAAKYDARVSKACVTASHPVFVSLTQHFLQNDVTSLVGTANHAELILNCLCNAFTKEPVADSVIRAVAQHCTVVPTDGILAALRLIALRGSADYNAANILFQHCLSKVIPDSSPPVLARSTLRLAQCGIRTVALSVAVDQRLEVIGMNCDAQALGELCEAQLLAHRESSPVLCRTIVALLRPAQSAEQPGDPSADDVDNLITGFFAADAAMSPVLRSMTLAQLRRVIMVLMAAGLVPLEDHLATLDVVLNRITSERSQLTANSSESASDILLVLQQLVRLRPFASSSSGAAPHPNSIRDAAAAFATAAESSIPNISGHAAQSADLAKAVEFVHCLAKLDVVNHAVMDVCLACVVQHQEAIQQRHVLMSKMAEVVSLLPATPDVGDDDDQDEDHTAPPIVLQRSIARHSNALREWMGRVGDTCGGTKTEQVVGVDEMQRAELSMQ